MAPNVGHWTKIENDRQERKSSACTRYTLEKFAKIEEKQTNVTDVNTDLSEDDNSHANSAATNVNIKLSEDDESYAKTTTGLGNSDAKEANIVKVLGLNWNTLTDNFSFDFYDLHNYAISLPASKRSVLKVTAKVFDPLGFLTPVMVNMKIFFQELFIDKAHWDEDLKGDTLRTWNDMLEELKYIRSVSIPRCYFESRPVEIQLHAFSDASERAYAAVVYLHSSYEDGRIVVRLVSSKSRVAPLKRQTIPRLELLGAVIQAWLVDKFTSATGIDWFNGNIVLDKECSSLEAVCTAQSFRNSQFDFQGKLEALSGKIKSCRHALARSVCERTRR